ncbi:MAG: hypothetical protein ACERKV_05110 [Clostridiaceae bacterium]
MNIIINFIPCFGSDPGEGILSDGSFVVKFSFPKGAWLYRYISSFGEE